MERGGKTLHRALSDWTKPVPRSPYPIRQRPLQGFALNRNQVY